MAAAHLPRQVVLKNKEEKRVAAGHPWVFSNEIRETKGNPAVGDIVEVLAASGLPLGVGFYHPHSLISVRLISRQVEEIDVAFFRRRLGDALALRQALYPGAAVYRLVHGEGDFLPGLIIDRYNDQFAVQTLSYGMDLRLAQICDLLEEMFHPAGIAERNESALRLLEGLGQKKGTLRGTPAPATIEEHGISYVVNTLEGQKTGLFLDQRENRAIVRRHAGGRHVLDCFCNDGGFGLNAARGGAATVLGIDASADAVTRAATNAELNGAAQIRFECADAFEKLDALAESGAKFDLVILDPPSFTRSRKNVQTAKKGYKDLHRKTFRILSEGGLLFTASCSHHIEADVFLDLVDETARKSGRQLQLLDWRGAAPDHPTLPHVPETRYLKFGVFRVH